MVGTNTALIDNPKLTVRKVKGNNPIRVVIDKNLKIPSSFHLLDGSVPTIIFTAKKKTSKKNIEFVKIDFKKNILKQITDELYDRKIQSLIVEGGTKLLNSFLEKNLWDEARVFTSTKTLSEITCEKEGGVEAPKMKSKSIMREKIGNDILEFYCN
jgi:diaminohydroxyphosphoribosylaminopyrimidine deaminase/5-amino-6-(5-phosphoribosylamino)uracil reductase